MTRIELGKCLKTMGLMGLLAGTTATTIGCAMHEKYYVSAIEIEGPDVVAKSAGYRPYAVLWKDKNVRLYLGCDKRTTLGISMFPLIPIPTDNFLDAKPHESLADNVFYIEVVRPEELDVDLSHLDIKVETTELTPMYFREKESSYGMRYEYVAKLHCSDIQHAKLLIKENDEKTLVYRMNFVEEVKRDIYYRLKPTT